MKNHVTISFEELFINWNFDQKVMTQSIFKSHMYKFNIKKKIHIIVKSVFSAMKTPIKKKATTTDKC